jgi:hypothetical protein
VYNEHNPSPGESTKKWVEAGGGEGQQQEYTDSSTRTVTTMHKAALRISGGDSGLLACAQVSQLEVVFVRVLGFQLFLNM